jgi:hydroxypyruvate isomerase
MRFAICLEMIFPNLPFLERARRVREAGFSAMEFWGWGGKDLDGLRGLVEAGLAVATFSGQRRGSLVDPQEWDTYREEVQGSFPVARRLGCDRLMVLTDELLSDGSARPTRPDLTPADKRRHVVRGLKDLAPLAEEAGITLLLEPLNTLVDHPRYFLESAREGFAIVTEVGSPRIRLLYDVYHMQIMEGNVTETLRRHLALVGHIHVADVPGRHEPGTGELNFSNILRSLADAGYAGSVGFEFSPQGDTQRALAAIVTLRQDLARQGHKVC